MSKNYQGNKTVVITGATRGLGKALSFAFAANGYQVIGIYHSDELSAKAINLEFREKEFQGIFIKQDITEDGKWLEFEENIKKCADKELTLIANACISFVPKPLHLIDWTEISQQIDVNVKGTYLVFKRLLPLMVKGHKGTVISVLTTALNPPPKGFAAYITAKSALKGLTKAVAAEYSTKGIKVFSVSPGFMETSLTKDWSEHLKALLYSDSKNPNLPTGYAAKILRLAQNTNIIGKGEDYLLDANQE